MAKRATPKKKTKSKPTKKKGTKKTPLIGLSLVVATILLIVAFTIVNYSKKKEPAEIKTDTIDNAIQQAAELLGVPDNLVRRRDSEDVITYSIQVDRGSVDLTFANMIMTGKIESAGGEIVSGIETAKGTAQILTIKDHRSKQEYTVHISYSKKDAYPTKLPKLAIIVDDFGETQSEIIDQFFQTDINVTFAIMPHLRHSRSIMDRAVASDREVILHIPMEPINYPRNNPGENPILVELSEREIQKTMEGYFKNLPAISGANNHMGSLATADERVMNVVLKSLKDKGLYFVDSRTTALSVAYDIAQKMMLPSAKRDMFLDAPDTKESTFKKKIQELKGLKDKQKQVVVITHCSDKTRLDQLNRFIDEAKKMGFEIVPVSKLFVSEVPEIL